MTRSDIHRVAEIDPEAYDYVDSYDLGTGADASPHDRRKFNDDLKWLGTQGKRLADHLDDGWRYTCGTCGQVGLRYVSLVVHVETSEYMIVGRTCIETVFDSARADLDARQEAAAKARKEAKLLTGFNEMLAAHPEIAEAPLLIERAFTFDEAAGKYWHEIHRKSWAAETARDIMTRARQYGGQISEKQIALVARIVRELIEAEAVTEKREAERTAARDAEVNAAIGEVGERREFTGEVVWCKDVANDFDPYGGMKTIMIIRTAEGMIKWFASKVVEVERGSKIGFTATVKAHEIYQERITTVVNRPTKIVIG